MQSTFAYYTLQADSIRQNLPGALNGAVMVEDIGLENSEHRMRENVRSRTIANSVS